MSHENDSSAYDQSEADSLIKVVINDRVAIVGFDYGPSNLLDLSLSAEINRVTQLLEKNDDVMVVIFRSLVPHFYLAHVDINVFIKGNGIDEDEQVLSHLREVRDRLKRWSKISIGEIEGRASGGGSELLLAMDMRFAATGKALVSQPEVSLGFIPCKGGIHSLKKLVGKSRAAEIVLGGAFMSADMLEAYGYINRALMPIALKKFVENLASNIAQSPHQAVLAAKKALSVDLESDEDAIALEKSLFDKVVITKESQQRLKRFVEEVGQDSKSELAGRKK